MLPPPEEILEHLRPYIDRLSARPEVKSPDEWYKLRSCAYYTKMLARKIIFPDLSAMPRFSLCDPDVLVLDGAYFIDSQDLMLLGILNSEVARDFYIKRCSSVGNLESKGRFRFKKAFIKNFPLPNAFLHDGFLRIAIEEVVANILKFGESAENNTKLNELVSELYGISQ